MSLVVRGKVLEYLSAAALEGDVVGEVVHGRNGGAHNYVSSNGLGRVLVKAEVLELLEVDDLDGRDDVVDVGVSGFDVGEVFVNVGLLGLAGEGVLGVVEDVLNLR